MCEIGHWKISLFRIWSPVPINQEYRDGLNSQTDDESNRSSYTRKGQFGTVHVLHPWTHKLSWMQSCYVFIDYRTYFNHGHRSQTYFKMRELTTFTKSLYWWFDTLWSQFFHKFLTFSPSVPYEMRQVCSAKCLNWSALSHCFNRWSMGCSVLVLVAWILVLIAIPKALRGHSSCRKVHAQAISS